MIRLLVVDDSAFARCAILRLTSADSEIEIVGFARDGIELLEQVKELKPDVITLDVEMPRMGGLEALETIMAEVPTPVVMASSMTGRGTETTIRALEVGANYVHGVQFRTTELRKYRDQARAKAIIAAKEKAVALAKELGQKVGQPRTINEGYGGWYSPYNSGWWGSYGYGGMTQNVVQNVGSGSSETEGTIALGMITVNAKITVTFELTD